MPQRWLCRVDRSGLGRLPLWAAVLVALSIGTGCNLILDNEQRALREPLVEPKPDASREDDASTMLDASTDASVDASTPEPDAGEPDAGRFPSSCLGTGSVPECTPGKSMAEKKGCGMCDLGQQMRERSCNADCTWAEWSEWTECLEYDDVCTPGKTDEQPTGPCGDCNTGTGKRTRVCRDSCGWSDWSEIQCTPSPDHCAPGTEEPLDPVACPGMCATQTVRRRCTDACTWDAPVMGACTSQGVCMPGETRMTMTGCNSDYCNKGVQQQMETCSQTCSWDAPVAVGMCSIPTNVCRPLDLGGTRGWRCRPNDAGYREFCHMSTAPEDQRCTWDGTRDPHPGPC